MHQVMQTAFQQFPLFGLILWEKVFYINQKKCFIEIKYSINNSLAIHYICCITEDGKHCFISFSPASLLQHLGTSHWAARLFECEAFKSTASNISTPSLWPCLWRAVSSVFERVCVCWVYCMAHSSDAERRKGQRPHFRGARGGWKAQWLMAEGRRKMTLWTGGCHTIVSTRWPALALFLTADQEMAKYVWNLTTGHKERLKFVGKFITNMTRGKTQGSCCQHTKAVISQKNQHIFSEDVIKRTFGASHLLRGLFAPHFWSTVTRANVR